MRRRTSMEAIAGRTVDSWKPLKISVRNLIRDFLEMYTAEPEEVVLTESIANSLDARSTVIQVGLEARKGTTLFRVMDNGTGMTREAFENSYHGIALSSKPKGEAIGFAGVGAKLYLAMLDSGNCVYTETRSDSFHGASEFGMIHDEAVWRNVEPRGKLSATGTYIEVKLAKKLERSRVEDVIRENYDAILKGLYGPIEIRVDWRDRALRPSERAISRVDTRFFRVGRRRCMGQFWLTRDETESPGLEIAVLGKKIRSEEWFNLQFEVRPEFSGRIGGMILADPLSSLLTTNKQDLRATNSRLWQEFRRKGYSVFKRWLQTIGAIQSLPKVRESDLVMTTEVSRTVNELLGLPALEAYRLWSEDPWTRDPWATTGTPVEAGKQGPHTFLAEYTVPIDAKKTVRSFSKGRPTRNERPGLSIRLANRPTQSEEAWVDSRGVVVNAGHPVFKRSQKTGRMAEMNHMMRCIFMALIENRDSSKKEILDELRGFYQGWADLGA
jgi:hypothetical protein